MEGEERECGHQSWGWIRWLHHWRGKELAGVFRLGSTGHGSTNGWYQEKAEAKAITTMPLARPRKARCGTRHGRQWRELTGAHEDSPRGHD
jgi:hypothetical protein